MACMSRSAVARPQWMGAWTRLATHPRTPSAAAAVLGACAMSESVGRAANAHTSIQYGLLLSLLALGTTMPLALPERGESASAVTAMAALSITPFQSLTLAGAGAELVALYRLGRGGSRVLVAVLAAPFLLLGIAGTADGETRNLAVVLGILAPAAAWIGAVRRSRAEAFARDAARQVVVGSCSSTPRAGNEPASRMSCMTWWPTTSP